MWLTTPVAVNADYAVQIARDGAVIRTKSGLKDHPLVRHELAARSFIVSTSKQRARSSADRRSYEVITCRRPSSAASAHRAPALDRTSGMNY
jgi:hypothetical protein